MLIDCVEGGASVSFMRPMTLAKAEPISGAASPRGVARGERALVVAEDGRRSNPRHRASVVGGAENQPHRADIAKMLVHSSARRLGVGAAVLRAAEHAARESGRNVLVLDTASDAAERLYERCGWQRVGTIPDFALMPDGMRCATVVYYKRLD